MTSQQLTGSLTEITERLAEIILQENQALKQRRPRELAETQAEKERLANEYEGKMRDFQSDPKLITRLQAGDVDRLKAATGRFQDALEDHRRLIQTTKSVTERMLREITREVARRQNPVTTYDQQAATRTSVMGKSRKTVTLAYNQTV